MSRHVRIAVAQYEPRVGEVEENLTRAVGWAVQAATEGAGLIVLPELASSGYVFSDEDEAARTAEDPDDGRTVRALREVCATHGCHIVAGINERDGDCRHNSAVLIGPSGRLATYRKLHLYNDEQSWFKPGDGLPVVDLPFGRIGIIICFDLWFPEAARALALAGADIIAVPTNWVASFKRTVYDDRGYCQGDYVAMVTAAQNGVVMACGIASASSAGSTSSAPPSSWAPTDGPSRDRQARTARNCCSPTSTWMRSSARGGAPRGTTCSPTAGRMRIVRPRGTRRPRPGHTPERDDRRIGAARRPEPPAARGRRGS